MSSARAWRCAHRAPLAKGRRSREVGALGRGLLEGRCSSWCVTFVADGALLSARPMPPRRWAPHRLASWVAPSGHRHALDTSPQARRAAPTSPASTSATTRVAPRRQLQRIVDHVASLAALSTSPTCRPPATSSPSRALRDDRPARRSRARALAAARARGGGFVVPSSSPGDLVADLKSPRRHQAARRFPRGRLPPSTTPSARAYVARHDDAIASSLRVDADRAHSPAALDAPAATGELFESRPLARAWSSRSGQPRHARRSPPPAPAGCSGTCPLRRHCGRGACARPAQCRSAEPTSTEFAMGARPSTRPSAPRATLGPRPHPRRLVGGSAAINRRGLLPLPLGSDTPAAPCGARGPHRNRRPQAHLRPRVAYGLVAFALVARRGVPFGRSVAGTSRCSTGRSPGRPARRHLREPSRRARRPLARRSPAWPARGRAEGASPGASTPGRVGRARRDRPDGRRGRRGVRELSTPHRPRCRFHVLAPAGGSTSRASTASATGSAIDRQGPPRDVRRDARRWASGRR